MNNTPKHTPGPWRVQNQWICDSTGLVTIATMPQHGVACENPAINPSDLMSEANARLIAAAPDMMQACKTGLKILAAYDDSAQYPDLWDLRQSLKAVIAKAEGL